MFASDLKALQESYQGIYEEGDGISCEMIEEVVEELIQECVEFGYTLDEASIAVENAAILYLDEAKVTYGSDTESPEQRKARAKERLGGMKSSARKAAVKTAVGRVQAKARGVKAAAGIAASIAKDEARRAGRAATHAVSSTVQKKKAEVKGGIKRMIGGGLRAAATGIGKVAQKAAGAASRLGEETLQEKQWIQGAIKQPGAFTKKAKSHGMTPKGFKKEVQAHPEKYPTKTERQANLMGTLQKLNKEEVDVFDLVLEYLLETGHAETISEAQYIMSQMDSEMIENILEDSSTLAAAARKRAQEMGAKRRRTPAYKAGGNRGTGRNERAAYNLSNTQRSAAANPDTQTTRSKKPSTMDTGMHSGDYDRYNRKDPKKNPKHNANK